MICGPSIVELFEIETEKKLKHNQSTSQSYQETKKKKRILKITSKYFTSS